MTQTPTTQYMTIIHDAAEIKAQIRYLQDEQTAILQTPMASQEDLHRYLQEDLHRYLRIESALKWLRRDLKAANAQRAKWASEGTLEELDRINADSRANRGEAWGKVTVL
jgi:thioester reductase-like protein